MCNTCTRILAGLAINCAMVAAAHADVVYDEGTDGELPDLYNTGGLDGYYSTGSGLVPGDAGDWADLGTLPVGTSTVSAEVYTIYTGSYNFDGDAVIFTVAPDTLLEEIIITATAAWACASSSKSMPAPTTC